MSCEHKWYSTAPGAICRRCGLARRSPEHALELERNLSAAQERERGMRDAIVAARDELARAWRDWDADRNGKTGKRIANASAMLGSALSASPAPAPSAETGGLADVAPAPPTPTPQSHDPGTYQGHDTLSPEDWAYLGQHADSLRVWYPGRTIQEYDRATEVARKLKSVAKLRGTEQAIPPQPAPTQAVDVEAIVREWGERGCLNCHNARPCPYCDPREDRAQKALAEIARLRGAPIPCIVNDCQKAACWYYCEEHGADTTAEGLTPDDWGLLMRTIDTDPRGISLYLWRKVHAIWIRLVEAAKAPR